MNKITICVCSSRTFIDKEKVALVAAASVRAGMDVELVSDLCQLCENKDAHVHEIAKTSIVACYERAVRSLMAFCSECDCNGFDLRSASAEQVLQALGIADVRVSDEEKISWIRQIEAMPCNPGADAWYPTLDKTQCIECGKCFEFCPFGVYEIVDDRIRVVHPSNCKNNCPACARMCPAGAIIFPKYDRSPINGGDQQQEETAGGDDAQQLYGQALRERLAERRTSILKKR